MSAFDNENMPKGNMQMFMARFPEKGRAETRVIVVEALDVEKDARRLPGGRYAFIEFFCSDPGCDCRRVLLRVVDESATEQRFLTGINFGWETVDFYEKWIRFGDREAASEMAGAMIEPFGPHSQWEDQLFDLFKTRLLTDESYVERLKRHYAELKRDIRREQIRQRPWAARRQTGGGRRRRR